MELRYVHIRANAGDGAPASHIPALLTEYCTDMEYVPPDTEIYLADPRYDQRTLHSSASFRDAIVRLRRPGHYDALTVLWKTAALHEIDPTGVYWRNPQWGALRYDVEYDDGSGRTYYMGILFGARA